MARMVTCAPCRVKVGFAASLSWSPYSDSLAVLPLATAIVRFAVASGWLYLLPLPTPEPVASVGAPSASLVDARPGKIGGVRHTFLVGPPAAAYPRNPPRFHPGFTPIFESERSTISLLLGGDLLPSKQVVAGSIPVSRSTPHQDVTTHAWRGPPKGGLLLSRQVVGAGSAVEPRPADPQVGGSNPTRPSKGSTQIRIPPSGVVFSFPPEPKTCPPECASGDPEHTWPEPAAPCRPDAIL